MAVEFISLWHHKQTNAWSSTDGSTSQIDLLIKYERLVLRALDHNITHIFLDVHVTKILAKMVVNHCFWTISTAQNNLEILIWYREQKSESISPYTVATDDLLLWGFYGINKRTDYWGALTSQPTEAFRGSSSLPEESHLLLGKVRTSIDILP